ncbi:MAG: MarR family transcriptional regulator [Gemmatimonadota bacterium]
MQEIPFFATSAAFAMRVGQLASTLYEQMDDCLLSEGLKLPGYATSIVQSLHHGGPQSISGLAQRLQLSHQLASQRVNWLVAAGLAASAPGKADRRVRVIRLTKLGQAEAEKLQAFLPRIDRAYTSLFAELGLDLHQAMLRASAALEERPLHSRFGEGATALVGGATTQPVGAQ